MGFNKFTRLRDTPDSYKDQAGKVATVKTGEDGLEFKEAPGLKPYAPAGCPIAYNDPL
ncbi:unnamed protein product, partial [marine sediment metagenome]